MSTIGNNARPIRSLVFFISGESGYRSEPALDSLQAGADAVGFDLEDYVHPSKLDDARQTVGEIVRLLGGQRYCVMARVHEGHETEEVVADCEALVCAELYGLLIPKVQPGDVANVSEVLDRVERSKGLAPGHTLLFPLLESAIAIEKAYDIASESARIAHMGWCVSRDGDPASSIGFRWTPSSSETLYMRSRALIAARAAGVPYPISGGWDPVTSMSQQLEGLRTFAIGERNLGYIGMGSGPDPASIAVVNEVFTPTHEDIARWQSLVVNEAEADTRGQRLMPSKARHARAQLDLAERLGLLTESQDS